jgi:hypothetical protein
MIVRRAGHQEREGCGGSETHSTHNEKRSATRRVRCGHRRGAPRLGRRAKRSRVAGVRPLDRRGRALLLHARETLRARKSSRLLCDGRRRRRGCVRGVDRRRGARDWHRDRHLARGPLLCDRQNMSTNYRDPIVSRLVQRACGTRNIERHRRQGREGSRTYSHHRHSTSGLPGFLGHRRCAPSLADWIEPTRVFCVTSLQHARG